MLLDDTQVRMKVGDTLVQQGTNHAWVKEQRSQLPHSLYSDRCGPASSLGREVEAIARCTLCSSIFPRLQADRVRRWKIECREFAVSSSKYATYKVPQLSLAGCGTSSSRRELMERLTFVEQGGITTFLRCIGHMGRQRYAGSCSIPPIACRWMHFTVGSRRAIDQCGRPAILDWPGGGYGFDFVDVEGRRFAVVCDVQDHADASMLRIDRTKSRTSI